MSMGNFVRKIFGKMVRNAQILNLTNHHRRNFLARLGIYIVESSPRLDTPDRIFSGGSFCCPRPDAFDSNLPNRQPRPRPVYQRTNCLSPIAKKIRLGCAFHHRHRRPQTRPRPHLVEPPPLSSHPHYHRNLYFARLNAKSAQKSRGTPSRGSAILFAQVTEVHEPLPRSLHHPQASKLHSRS